ncbi:MAG: alanyl-tRNA editing protein [Hyphomicrobiales bacterium]|nr:alanyl-tRNA editing protein [Hyphomicrobiales bacterium]
MTDRVFWRDPYLRELATRVATVDGPRVTLAETIFYAESGGQESDAGTIAGHPVLEALMGADGADIVYTLPDGHGLAAGDPVTVRIDWDRRYRLMRLHFAAEVILELVYQTHPGTAKTGAHIAADKARIDFQWDGSIAGILPDLQARAESLIAADRPIVSDFSDAARRRRYWRVDGFAQVPCGGTHLRSTGEVGALRLKRRNPGKGRERVEITLA